ncbi:uncharacterized protein M6B38_204690 [Iris pallida]|uniref:Uncharacterized protein n=1 Tax=Iris pallida TaxID=29817 RepID=A0AAX6E832_IRIPA|nr:uncharacterized protein M6B38_204690 [Iris pallida]
MLSSVARHERHVVLGSGQLQRRGEARGNSYGGARVYSARTRQEKTNPGGRSGWRTSMGSVCLEEHGA